MAKSKHPAGASSAAPRKKGARRRRRPAAAAAPAAAVAAVAPAATKPVAIPRDRISARAHQIWIDEGRPDGRALEHWVRAERELRG